jgi:glycerol-3-phosphate cytidylyltransferase
MRRVITYGNFDLLHYGHHRLLRRARKLGDHLIVGLSTGKFSSSKGKRVVEPYGTRELKLFVSGYVDKVIPETRWSQKRDDILKYEINIFVMGDDWKGKFDDLSDICQVIYLERTPDVSTSLLKEQMECQDK